MPWFVPLFCCGGEVGELLMFAATDLNATLAASRFLWPNEYDALDAERRFIRVPRDGTISKFFVYGEFPGTNSEPNIFRLEVDSADSGLEVTIPSNTTPFQGSEKTTIINVLQGARISVEVDWDAIPAGTFPQNVVVGLLYKAKS